MKEICFRAWDKKEKKMHNVIQILWGSEPNPHPLSVDFFDSIKPHLFEDVELMQYTGLRDKNGKRIYEGDIVKFDKYEWYRSPVRTKKDIDKLPEYYEEVTFDHIGVHISESDLNTYCEVVGNKFENPELLVKTEK